MKGITPVIAVILLLLITIAMVGFAFVWFGRVASLATNATEEQLRSQLLQQAKRISIDNVNSAGANVTIRNIGTAVIPRVEINVYVGGSQQTCVWDPNSDLPPGETRTCDWSTGTCTAGTVVRITAPGNFDESRC